MWLAMTAMLGLMSGWFDLQQWYADEGDEQPLLTLRGQSGSMGTGFGVGLNGILTLSVKRSGLSIRIWRIFGPFQKPLLIPWREISAEPKRVLFMRQVKLRFGNPANGQLRISQRTWSRLAVALPRTDGGGPLQATAGPPVSPASVARGMLFEWLAITSFAATFFYIASRTNAGEGLPLGLCIGFPAVVFGIGQLIRYARQA
jgi:hypothetical protein